MRKIVGEWWKTGVLLIGILLLGLGIRIYNLVLLPVFADEAIYIRWSQIMGNEPTLRFLPLSDGKQPLFMWVLMFLVRRFSDPLFIGRVVSVMTGLGIMVAVFGVSFLVFRSKVVALASSFLWAISPYAVFFDRMALVDSMLAFWVIVTLFWGILMAKTRRLDAAMVTGFALGFAGLTKSPAMFAAGLLPSVWVLGSWRNLTSSRRGGTSLGTRVVWAGFLLVVAYAIAFGMYNIQRLGPNFHMLSARTKDYVFPLSHLWENPKDPFIFHFHRGLQWIWIMGPSLIYGLVLLGMVVDWKKFWKERMVLGLWFVGPLAVQAMFAKTFTARYIFYTLPPLFVLAGAAFLGRRRLVNKIGIVVLVGFVLQAVWFNYYLLIDPEKANLPRSERSGYLEEWTAGTGIAEAAEMISAAQRENPSDNFVVGTEGYFGTLPDGLQIYVEGVPRVTVIGVGLGIKEVPEQLKESFEAGNKTYLLANTSRLKFEKDPQELGLELVASWEKAERPEGYREYVQHGMRDYLQLWEVIR